MYPSYRCKIEECEDLISQRIWFMYENLKSAGNSKNYPNPEISGLPSKSFKLYKKCLESPKKHQISTFN